jgi:transposase-like protein
VYRECSVPQAGGALPIPGRDRDPLASKLEIKSEHHAAHGFSTNIMENLNRGIRKYSKTKSIFPHDQAALKAVFLAIYS